MDMDHIGEHGEAVLHSMGPMCSLYLCWGGGGDGPTGGLYRQVVGVMVLLVAFIDRLWGGWSY